MAEKDLGNRLRRAVKENNLAHVKRLIQRVDMRNPDPGPLRYTSLAWAAVCGNEDVFDYLLQSGHDDEELSKDAENNTVLILLASLGSIGNGSTSGMGRSSAGDLEMRNAAQRMARSYFERYPFIIDWSNLQGKTALHVAAIKGTEEFVRTLCDFNADFDMPDAQGNTPLHYASAWGHLHIIQLLIERGCQYAAKNDEGFTASDYAYSTTTWDTLQDAARAHHEQKKIARRNVFNQAAQRGTEWSKSGYGDQQSIIPSASDFADSRVRSGSGTSRLSLDDSPRTHVSNLKGSSSSSTMPSRSGQAKVPLQQMYSTLSASSSQRSHPYLSPVATRMREKDADAMAEYMKRSRSGSNGGAGIAAGGGTSMRSVGESLLGVSTTPQPRKLRGSMSAASLRVTPPLSSSPPDNTAAQRSAAESPQKSAPRKLISRSRRPGTADGAPAPRRNPFSLLSSRHNTNDNSSHERVPSVTGNTGHL
ncbi:ankyrin [Exidia glandulosa HHB12029]|uniref:Ankyrin n=1 Tax=Exidia glandulosa HHB12029 TaxID=1314781 RepID=A0A165QUX0_EXIGL|nr:ankyrin [Exidia glandulosa HHB12029]